MLEASWCGCGSKAVQSAAAMILTQPGLQNHDIYICLYSPFSWNVFLSMSTRVIDLSFCFVLQVFPPSSLASSKRVASLCAFAISWPTVSPLPCSCWCFSSSPCSGSSRWNISLLVSAPCLAWLIKRRMYDFTRKNLFLIVWTFQQLKYASLK